MSVEENAKRITPENYFEQILLPLDAIINVMIIIAARMHYTADIVIGFVLSILVSFELSPKRSPNRSLALSFPSPINFCFCISIN